MKDPKPRADDDSFWYWPTQVPNPNVVESDKPGWLVDARGKPIRRAIGFHTRSEKEKDP